MRRRLLVGLGLLGALAVGAVGLRVWARDKVAARLLAEARARGVDLRWESLALTWGGQVQVGGLSARTARPVRGHVAELTVRSLRVDLRLDGARPSVARVAVQGVEGQVDEAPQGAVGGEPVTSGAQPWPPWVAQVDGVDLTVNSHGVTGRVRLDALTVDGQITGDVEVALARGDGTVNGRGTLVLRRDDDGWQVRAAAPEGWRVQAEGADAWAQAVAWADGALVLEQAGVARAPWRAQAAEARWRDGRVEVRDGRVDRQGWPPMVLEQATLDLAGPVTARGRIEDGRFDVAADTWPHPSFVAAELDRLPVEGEWFGFPAWQARLSGTALLGADGPLGRAWPLTVVADGALDDGAGQHPLLGPEPLTDLGGSLALDAVLAPGAVAIEQAVAQRGALTVRAQGGFVDDAQGGTVDLHAAVDPVDCQAALDAVPASVLGPWQGLTAEGTWKPQVWASIPLGRPADVAVKIRGVTRRCTFTGLEATRAPDPDVRVGDRPADLGDVTWLNEPFRFRVRDGLDEGVERWVGPGAAWVPYAHLPPYVGGAAYLTEEMNFWHGGAISPGLIGRAVATNLAAGRYVYGGSTVTQQLVKNLFFARDKTLLRKIREAFVAARVTDAVPKARILALYLNCIEFGPNVFGVGAAARYYFQKPASTLTVREAIFLAMLKPAPRRGGWYKRKGSEPDFPWWRGRVVQVADRLLEAGLISRAQRDQAIAGGPLRWEDGRYVGQGG